MSSNSLTKIYKKRCSKCGNYFDTPVAHGHVCKPCKETPKVFDKICPICHAPFQAHRSNHKYCSLLCRNRAPIPCRQKEVTIKRKNCVICETRFIPEHPSEKYCSEKCRKEANLRFNAAYREKKRVAQLKRSSTNDRRKETVNPDEMPILNKVTNRNDKDKLRKAKVASPDHTQMPFKHYDKKMKCMRFFRSQDKYNNFLETIQNQEA